MRVDREEARRIAALAHLRFDEDGLDRMAAEMTAILTYIDQLSEVDVAGVEESSVEPMVLRDDEARPSLDRDSVERNAPDWRDGFFVVPKVIGGE